MAVFQNILNALSDNKREQKKEEKRLQDATKDYPILKKYYEKVNRAEKKLQEGGGGINFSSPKSERFIFDNDLGQQAETKRKGDRIVKTGGWTNLFTKQDLNEAGFRTNSKGVTSAYVPSTAIKRIRYNPKTKNLYIKFTSGDKEYLYPNVPEKEVQKYLVADSKGRYNYHKIRPKYAVSKEEALKIKAESKNK